MVWDLAWSKYKLTSEPGLLFIVQPNNVTQQGIRRGRCDWRSHTRRCRWCVSGAHFDALLREFCLISRTIYTVLTSERKLMLLWNGFVIVDIVKGRILVWRICEVLHLLISSAVNFILDIHWMAWNMMFDFRSFIYLLNDTAHHRIILNVISLLFCRRVVSRILFLTLFF